MSNEEECNEFNATFDSILSYLIPKNPNEELSDTYIWLKKTILYNVPNGKCNRGLIVVDTVRLIAEQKKRNINESELELARVLGWTVEFFQAHFLIVDDIIDQSITRRGQPCWYKLDEVGLSSCNDAILVDQEMYHILRIFFSEKPYYKQILDLMHQMCRLTALGQYMDLASNPANKGPQFQMFTQSRYNNIIKYKTAFYSISLPVRLAMYMSGIFSSEEHKIAEDILLEIGCLAQVQDDFFDCWGDPAITGKIGTDIEEGKCCWPIIAAFHFSDQKQLEILKENYGKKDSESVQRVKAVYSELKLQEVFLEEAESRYKKISKLIENSDSNCEINQKIFYNCLNRFYKRIK